MTKICITGADGTGKSTLIKSIARSFESVRTAKIWDLLKDKVNGLPFASKQQVDNYLCTLTPEARLLFMAHALSYSTQKAIESNTDIILLNGYIYKYFASELALGASSDLASQLAAHFPEPDLIIELKLPPEIAAERKERFSRYECALAKSPNKLSFINFQYRIAESWNYFNHKSEINTFNTSLSPDKLLHQAEDIIENNLKYCDSPKE